MAISRISFLTPANFDSDDPRSGLEAGLDLFAYGESLGYHGAWVRSRHLERGVGSAATFLAAATQRTRRIELGTAVIQLGYEAPFRLAEDLATVDVLSGGRLQIGVSAGPPAHAALIGDGLEASTGTDFGYGRVLRLRDHLQSQPLGSAETRLQTPAGQQRPRLHPIAPGLAERLWYGAGSLRSADWAGRNGLGLLTGNVIQGEGTDDFYAAQVGLIRRHADSWAGAGPPRVALGRVIVPLDSAKRATRDRHRAFFEARLARTRAPQGERRTLFLPDLVGTSDEILGALDRDPVLPLADELRLELPYDLPFEEYRQILDDFAYLVAPHLGWSPAEDFNPTAVPAGARALLHW